MAMLTDDLSLYNSRTGAGPAISASESTDLCVNR